MALYQGGAQGGRPVHVDRAGSGVGHRLQLAARARRALDQEVRVLPWRADLAGRLDEQVIVSELLKGNPRGDPYERPLWIYVPPGYDDEPERRYPSIYVIQGFTGHIAMWSNRTAFRQPFPELADAMFARGEAPPAIVVYVDAWTSLGGSQFLDSPATGAYHSYLCEEVVGFVDARYRTVASRDRRAIAGKSSGGYGAMVNAMLRPDVFGGFATHAGDSLFEIVAPPMFGKVVRFLRDIYAYAAAYSAEPDGTVLLPFDDTGRLIPEVWARWLAWDPVHMAAEERYAEALRSMRAIWIDAGTRDEYFLDLGSAAFRRAVAEAGVTDERVHFELFDATHAFIEYR